MKNIIEKVDHTLLKPLATWEDIKKICDEAKEMKVLHILLDLWKNM